MSILYIQSETLTDMANVIRAKVGTSSLMSPSTMINTIQNIGGVDLIDFIKGDLSIFENYEVDKIRNYAFYSCSSLQLVNLSNTNYIGNNAFAYCTSLQSVNLPMASYIGSSAFAFCSSLQSINLSNVNNIAYGAFIYCRSLQSVDLPAITYINYAAFAFCTHLLSLYLSGSSVCELNASDAFTSTPIGGYTGSTGGQYGSIYVPASLYSDYIAATNWAALYSRFVSV